MLPVPTRLARLVQSAWNGVMPSLSLVLVVAAVGQDLGVGELRLLRGGYCVVELEQLHQRLKAAGGNPADPKPRGQALTHV